jgi:hypothetical protein
MFIKKNNTPFDIFIEPLGIGLSEVNNINVRPVDWAHIPHSRVQHWGDSPVDTSDRDPVTRLNLIHQVIVAVEQDGLRRLSSRHVIYKCVNLLIKKKWSDDGKFTGRFLQLDQLLVAEVGSVVHQGKAMVCVAVATEGWLSNAATVHFNLSCASTDDALEEGLPHFGDDVRCADHHATQCNELINV